MKKLLVRLGIVAVLGLVLLLGAGWLLVTPASRAAVEKGGRYALGVDTTIDDVVLSPSLGSSAIGFTQLKVDNPDGMTGDPLLEIDEFRVGVRTLSLMSSTVKVPEITLEGLDLRLIQDGKRSNFYEVVQHIRGLSGDGESAAKTTETESSGESGPMLALGTISVKSVTGSLELRGIPGLDPLSQSFTLPDFEFDVVEALGLATTEGGDAPKASVGDLTAALVDELIQQGIEEAKSHLDPEVRALLDQDLGKALLEQLEGEKEGLLKEAGDALEGELQKGLEGILGGKK